MSTNSIAAHRIQLLIALLLGALLGAVLVLSTPAAAQTSDLTLRVKNLEYCFKMIGGRAEGFPATNCIFDANRVKRKISNLDTLGRLSGAAVSTPLGCTGQTAVWSSWGLKC